MWTKRTVLTCFFVLAFMAAAGSAMAQSHSVGVRGGISVDPDQVYLGAHVDLMEVSKRFWFRPNAELGLGSGVTVVALNGEFVYKLRAISKEWTPYLGGGPAFVVRSFRAGPNDRDTDVGPGFNFVGGIQQPRGLLAEVKIGVLDSPDFKLGIGWTW